MKNLEITIKFFDYWHCSSGQSGGNASDALVEKHRLGKNKGLPYVPGRTLKGLIRAMAEEQSCLTCKELQEWFGNTSDKDNMCFQKEETDNTKTYIDNADIKDMISQDNISKLFKRFQNTALENGIAKTNSLRTIEAVIPLEMIGLMTGIDTTPDKLDALKNAIKSVKRIGLSRNRGFGRCEIDVKEIEV